VTRRIVTNGSIYIDMAQLTTGQLMLLDLPDAAAESGPGPELLAASLSATLAPTNTGIDMSGHAELVCHDRGDALLPRTIRYIEDRRANESRYTGAIETHPSPLHVIWGPEDPIAVPAMAERLASTRPDATLTWIPNTGHYPQLEDPAAWLAAVTTAPDPHRPSLLGQELATGQPLLAPEPAGDGWRLVLGQDLVAEHPVLAPEPTRDLAPEPYETGMSEFR
jgi:hypothetical protein